MQQNDFTIYKEGGDVLSMGFKINSIIAKQGLPVMVGGQSPFNKNKFDNLNVPLPLAVLHKKFREASYESMSGGDKIEDDNIDIEKVLDNQQIDDLLFNKLLELNKVGGVKKQTKKQRKKKYKRKTKKN